VSISRITAACVFKAPTTAAATPLSPLLLWLPARLLMEVTRDCSWDVTLQASRVSVGEMKAGYTWLCGVLVVAVND
jgi:hypothetical protein